MQILKYFSSIFLDETFIEKNPGCPINLTKHYKMELGNIYFDEICVGADYVLLEDKIERYKYHSDRQLSTEFGEVLSKCVEVSEIFGEQTDWVIVPIPMHWSRYFLRGFHHTRLLARMLGKVLNCETQEFLETRFRKRQAKLSRTMRIENKKNSFFIKNQYTIPSHVILIDDVISTGSTLNEAAKILKERGVKKILCFTLASNAKICQNLSKLSVPKPTI